MTAHLGLSQTSTSFIASSRLDIHHAPLVAWPHLSLAYARDKITKPSGARKFDEPFGQKLSLCDCQRAFCLEPGPIGPDKRQPNPADLSGRQSGKLCNLHNYTNACNTFSAFEQKKSAPRRPAIIGQSPPTGPNAPVRPQIFRPAFAKPAAGRSNALRPRSLRPLRSGHSTRSPSCPRSHLHKLTAARHGRAERSPASRMETTGLEPATSSLHPYGLPVELLLFVANGLLERGSFRRLEATLSSDRFSLG